MNTDLTTESPDAETSDSDTPALVFDDLSMTFPDGTHALDHVSFSVSRGEFVTVVGPSGCGKSTLLRIASGLEQNTGGLCQVDHDSIGYVFQDATLFPWRTVRRNVELLAELHGLDLKGLSGKVDESLELVNLLEHQDKYPKQLSGGMRMRASLARSLVLQPDVFLFDEPFGALDEISRERLNDELLSLFKAKNFAGLFITHSIAEAVFLSTRVLVMSARPGRIIADYEVPFEYPRRHDIRYLPEFAELSGQISHDLRGAHP
ncbi:putative ABC transporter ATP-binding protein [Ilumatobacter coccineus YM16-304]|uniref:Putative ABC transporter ATP-binding protein n=2 Tax=Ilumatobacter coccineus TaxID=467094 RepID=A0A6C7EFV3_ILUCY|nr:putative ABC transporter ATP-binding protein [Ilumatobacter coccineus YM16-304]